MACSPEETEDANILISCGPESSIKRAPRRSGIKGVRV